MSGDVKSKEPAPERIARLMRAATYLSVATATVLIVVKFIAWEVTGSLSLLGSLLDSILDAAASLVNLFAVRHALMPPDKEHRFGHGKAEPLAALAQSAFICGSALFLAIQSIERLIDPQEIESGTVGLAVMVFSIAATLGLVAFQSYVVKRTSSLAIAADSLHYKGDLLMNAMVIVALILSVNFGWIIADPIIGLGIAGYIIWCAWAIAKDALNMLMDRELQDDERKKIIEIITANEEIRGYHDLRTRASGPQTFIQCHIEMDGSLSLWQAHEVADRVEKQLEDAFPGAEVILHEDPYLGDRSQRSKANQG
ncbi:MAG: cation diffusion facilitator family transporter [Kiloniellales bacterium]|nr:cation diffusion facilitator family transporter [Kiloniellales bacterium]